MAFTPTDVRLGGSFVQDLSGFQRDTLELTSFFAGKAREKSVSKALSEVDALDADGKPVLNKRGTFKAADRAFNEASVKAYQAAVQNDAMESVSRIMAENPDNPEAFQVAIDGFKEGFFGEVEQSVRPNIISLVDTLETKARINVNSAFRVRANEENKVKLDRARDGFSSQAMSSIFEGDLESFDIARTAYMESLDNPLLSATEIADMILAFNEDADENQFLGAIKTRYDEDPKNALIALSAFQNTDASTLSMSPERQLELVAKGFQSISNREKLAESIETVSDEETKRSQLSVAADLTAKAYGNELSEKEFLDAVKRRKISPSQADSIKKRMNNTYAIKDNPRFIVDFTRDMPDLTTAEAEALIDSAIGDGLITASTANAMQKSLNARDEKEEDLEINNNRDLLKTLVKPLTGPGATFLDPTSEARSGFALAEYNRRTAEGENPTDVLNDVLEASNKSNEIILRGLPALKFGKVEDLTDAKSRVLDALDNGIINNTEAEKQLGLIQTMEQLKLGTTKK